METPSVLFISARLILILGVLGFGQFRRLPLDLTMLITALALGFSYGITPIELIRVMFDGCFNMDMLALLAAIIGILGLSGLLDKSGQNHRLTNDIRARLTSPKLRLAFFPALIGLLPMPGGAIFSCPMVKELSADMPVSNLFRASVNCWFRHIWETVWPLYPGLVLACILSELSPLVFLAHSLPLLVLAVFAGWIVYLRKLPKEDLSIRPITPKSSWKNTCFDGMPIITGLLLSFGLYGFFPMLPAGICFGIGFFSGITVCALQNDISASSALQSCITPKNLRMITAIMTIFMFKAVLEHCGFIAEMGMFAKGNQTFLFAACIFLSIIGGILTGILVGGVGLTFPVITELLRQADMWDDRAPWLALTVIMCYIGEMMSPVHICLVLSSNYFNVSLGSLLKHLFIPTMITAMGSIILFSFYMIFIY